ncbi:MAG TPA: response regulator transcription factor, partial [Cyclobacteriaceae bacterium]|nr:response regulator transcription factor [Cyclobacteriaceae bacterium]
AVDYLLKPISMDRFMKAMTKIIEPSRVTTQTTPLPLWVKSGNKTYKLSIDDILYLRKDGNYLTYFTSTTKVMARESVGEALSKLPSFFVQCHKSHIINIRHITSFTKESVFINEIEISIGSSFRDNLTKVITEINN